MQMIDEIIAISLPFGFSAVLQLLQPGIRAYAERARKITWDQATARSPGVAKLAVELTVHVFEHLSYVFSLLLSCVSCIAITITSEEPLYAAVGVAFLLVLLPIWLVYWQGLTADELASTKGRSMRVSAWIAILVQYAISIHAYTSSSHANCLDGVAASSAVLG
jgi:hypothetical protein